MWSTWLFVFLGSVSVPNPDAEIINKSSAVEFSTSNSILEPLPEERIDPIILKNKCANGVVIEWQDELPSDDKVAIINEVCNIAVNNFSKFLKTKKIITPKDLNLKFSLSLLNRGDKKRSTTEVGDALLALLTA